MNVNLSFSWSYVPLPMSPVFADRKTVSGQEKKISGEIPPYNLDHVQDDPAGVQDP